jgi:hypothetical protein
MIAPLISTIIYCFVVCLGGIRKGWEIGGRRGN